MTRYHVVKFENAAGAPDAKVERDAETALGWERAFEAQGRPFETVTVDVTISRDGTFEYDGRTYRVGRGSDRPNRDGWPYEVYDEETSVPVLADGLFTMDEVRREIARHAAYVWPLADDPSPTH